MRRLLPLLVLVGALVPPTAFAILSATRLAGTTGPGFTITVKKAGKKVTRLTPGKFTITVADKSDQHDFFLNGPGIRDRRITGLAYMGSRTVAVTLRRGRYEYYCRPHRRLGMRGYITVR